MGSYCLLVQATDAIMDDNYLRIGRALCALGHRVSCAAIDSLRLIDGGLLADGFAMDEGLRAGQGFPRCSPVKLLAADVVWVLGLGERGSFLDKVQLLRLAESHALVINSPDALMHLKSKYSLTAMERFLRHPETHASCNAGELLAIMKEKGGDWVAKPPAGSLGRDVFRISAADRNAPALLQHLCGQDNSRYALLQRYLPQVAQTGEKRVLVAGGQVAGQYRRLPGKDHRTNVSLGAVAEACSLCPEEAAYCTAIAQELLMLGVHYAGLDLAYPWVIEVNVVNPGGLRTLESICGTDLSHEVAGLVDASVRRA